MTESALPPPGLPERHVSISEQDALALIAIVARVHSEMLVDKLDEGFPKYLQRRLRDARLIDAGAEGGEASTALNGELSSALGGIVARLRTAVGDE